MNFPELDYETEYVAENILGQLFIFKVLSIDENRITISWTSIGDWDNRVDVHFSTDRDYLKEYKYQKLTKLHKALI